LYNETADGNMPPKYDDVIELEHLNPGANHDKTLTPLNIITLPDGIMPPPPSYDDALTGLYQASPLDAKH